MNILEEMIEIQRIVCIEIINDSKRIPLYTMLIEQADSIHYFLKRRLPASGPTIFIMKLLWPVNRYTDKEIVLLKELTPFISE